MANPTTAELIWNRALGDEVFRFLKGDLALIEMLRVHGYVMNGGVLHAVESCDAEGLAEMTDAYRFFGLDEVAALLSEAKSAFDSDDLQGSSWEEFDQKYVAAISDDDALFTRFEATLRLNPSKFAPV